MFDIKIILQDDHFKDELKKVYDITLVIVKDWTDPIEPLIEEAKKVKVINEYSGRVYDLTETTIEDIVGEDANTEDPPIDYYTPKNIT